MHKKKASNLDQLSFLSSLSPKSTITLFPLQMRKEKDEYIAGRMGTGTFVMLPEIGGKIIQLFQQDYTLVQVEKRLAKEYGEEIDISEFIGTLMKLDFIVAIDGQRVGEDKTYSPSLPWITAQHLTFLHAVPTVVIYCLILIAAFITILLRPQLIPSYADFFWIPITSVVIITNLTLSSFFVALHELAHLFLARSFGVPGRISFGTRLHYLVVQTDVTGVWILPKKQRYLVYLAGMLTNLGLMALAILCLAYLSLSGLPQQLLRVVILLNFLSIVREFYLYMRTDMYFVLLNVLNASNLFNDALTYFRYRIFAFWHRIWGRTIKKENPLLQLPLAERHTVAVYMWFMIIGSVIALSMFALYGIPIALTTYLKAFHALVTGIFTRHPGLITDGCITLLVEATFLFIYLKTFIRTHQSFITRVKKASSVIRLIIKR